MSGSQTSGNTNPEDRFQDPAQIFAISGGFQASRILLSAVELDLFTRLADQSRTAAELAAGTGVSSRALAMLLDALAALGFLLKQENRYANTPASARQLVEGKPESILPALRHHAGMWQRWHDLTGVIRRGGPAALPGVNDRGEEWLENFLGAMEVFSRSAAPEVAAALPLADFRRMLDAGGGAASYTIAFLRQAPGLEAVVADLPNVLPIARRAVEKAGLSRRVHTVACDYNHDPLPSGFDLVLLSAIIHSNSAEENRALVAKCHQALEPDGMLVIRDFLMSPDRLQPAPGAIFAINMLAGTEGGGTYTAGEVHGWLAGAGFDRIETIGLPLMNAMMTGRKPRT